MKRIFAIILAIGMLLTGMLSMTSCGVEKNITVVAREQSSGTREAFDKVVTNGEHFLMEKDEQGEYVFYTTVEAIFPNSTGVVLSTVASDVNAIGYISLGSVNDSINVIKVNGILPTNETVLDGSYKIQRPFVIMTNSTITLTERAQDFMNYVKSSEAKAHTDVAGAVFLEDSTKRANEDKSPIPVIEYTRLSTLPKGEKIVVRGSTSMEKLINSLAKGYADMYGVDPANIFDIELEGSSVGRKAVENDTVGNVIGLSSASVNQNNVESFNICLDAVAVIVNKDNNIDNLTLEQLYRIYTGEIRKFSEIE
ncbi:MAG: substrate-binding domain-containing protein [Clostridia bacterium]|nr:substrate-binding domain-containing protein [Clostridia bacterium]